MPVLLCETRQGKVSLSAVAERLEMVLKRMTNIYYPKINLTEWLMLQNRGMGESRGMEVFFFGKKTQPL